MYSHCKQYSNSPNDNLICNIRIIKYPSVCSTNFLLSRTIPFMVFVFYHHLIVNRPHFLKKNTRKRKEWKVFIRKRKCVKFNLKWLHLLQCFSFYFQNSLITHNFCEMFNVKFAISVDHQTVLIHFTKTLSVRQLFVYRHYHFVSIFFISLIKFINFCLFLCYN